MGKQQQKKRERKKNMNFENTNLFNVCNQLFKSLFKGGHFVVETGWKAHVFDRKYVIAVEIRLLRVDSKLFRSRTRTRSLLIHCYLPTWMHKWQSAYNYEVSMLRYFDWYISEFIRELNKPSPPNRSPIFCSPANSRQLSAGLQNLGDPLSGDGLFNSLINSGVS